MKLIRSTLVVSLLVLAACADQASPVGAAPAEPAPLLIAAPGQGIPGEYIVVLKEGADPRRAALAARTVPGQVFTAALNGFAAKLTPGQVSALRRNPVVAYVEQNQVAAAQAIHWGLDRIDQVYLPLDGSYTASTPASNVYAYVIDTGIDPAHAELAGRVVNVYDAFGGSGAGCTGHGTIVARIIGSSTVGVATGINLRGVRVLDCAGLGTTAGVIGGVEWVRVNRTNPAVANLSLAGGASLALNTAVNNLASSGVPVAVPAGNNNTNACNVSPAGAGSALTVAASTSTDASTSFTNFGSCVDLYAPGSAPGATGTSFATAYVAGTAALFKSYVPTLTTQTVNAWIVGNATPGILTGVPAGTPNLLLYKSSL